MKFIKIFFVLTIFLIKLASSNLQNDVGITSRGTLIRRERGMISKTENPICPDGHLKIRLRNGTFKCMRPRTRWISTNFIKKVIWNVAYDKQEGDLWWKIKIILITIVVLNYWVMLVCRCNSLTWSLKIINPIGFF